jgi:hypothetical protein
MLCRNSRLRLGAALTLAILQTVGACTSPAAGSITPSESAAVSSSPTSATEPQATPQTTPQVTRISAPSMSNAVKVARPQTARAVATYETLEVPTIPLPPPEPCTLTPAGCPEIHTTTTTAPPTTETPTPTNTSSPPTSEQGNDSGDDSG